MPGDADHHGECRRRLLRALCASAGTRGLPLILLSARAGEEARVEGLEARADDYLVKPFSARELLARVRANLDLARTRQKLDLLRESGAKYRILFETMGQGYCELEFVRNPQGRAIDQRYLALNPAFERLFGIPVAAAQSRLASAVFPGLEPCWTEAFDRMARTGRPERV